MYDPVAAGARCDLCPLSKERTPVAPEPAATVVRLIIVSEVVGRAEVKTGRQLAGRGGDLVRRLVIKGGIKTSETHVTPAALCLAETDKEADAAALCCAPRLLRELAVLPAAAPILVLGKHALATVLGARNLLVCRGFIWRTPRVAVAAVKAATKAMHKAAPGIRRNALDVKAETLRWRRKLRGRVVVPSLAPSFVSRADTWKPLLEIDVGRVAQAVSGQVACEDSGPYMVYPGSK